MLRCSTQSLRRRVTLFERAEAAVSRLPAPARRRAFRVGYVLLRGWWLVRRPRTEGVKIVVRREDDVLLVRHTYGRRGEWDLPGGFLEQRRGAAGRGAARDRRGARAAGGRGPWRSGRCCSAAAASATWGTASPPTSTACRW